MKGIFHTEDAEGAERKMPVRIQLSRKRGWELPANTVVVARGPGRGWGNPFRAINPEDLSQVQTAVDYYRRYLTTGTQGFLCGPESGVVMAFVPAWHHASDLRKALPGLRGKNLACWCKPGAPCHADVLLELANRKELAS